MKKKIKRKKKISFFGTSSFFVFFYGVFLIISLFLQCLIPFISRMLDIDPQYKILDNIFNNNFKLPMATMAWSWSILCGTYVFSDRVAFTISAFTRKDGNGHLNMNDMPNIGNMDRLKFIIWESFIVYFVAVLLYLLFDTDLQLEPLFGAFASSIIAFVNGNKAIRSASAMSKKDDIDGNGIKDEDEDIVHVIKRYKERNNIEDTCDYKRMTQKELLDELERCRTEIKE